MSWWQKLQSLMWHGEEDPAKAAGRPSELFIPSAVQALASGNDDNVFRVEIRGVGVSAIRVQSARPMREASYVVRVPVGLNFEKRETTEYVEFTGVPFYVHKTDQGHETFLRYAETSNARRDRWLRLILESYGFSINEAGEIEARVHDLPCVLTLAGTARQGRVESVSLKGMMLRIDTAGLHEGDSVGLRVGGAEAPPMKGTVATLFGSDGLGVTFDEVTNEQYRHLLNQVALLAGGDQG